MQERYLQLLVEYCVAITLLVIRLSDVI